MVGFSKGGDLALALAVTQGSNVSLKPVKALICANFLSGRSSSLDKWVFGKRWGGNHKRGLKSIIGRICYISETPPGSNTLPCRRIEVGLQAKITRRWNPELLWSPGGEWYPYTALEISLGEFMTVTWSFDGSGGDQG